MAEFLHFSCIFGVFKYGYFTTFWGEIIFAFAKQTFFEIQQVQLYG